MKKILENNTFQKKLAQLAQQTGESLEYVNKEAALYLKELYTVQEPFANVVAVQMAQYILSRGYDKTIDVNPSQLKKLAKLMHRHPIAFVMTHKTYIDMFVLGLVLARHGLPLPYTFSGINMSFFGLGQFGRQVGVLFIRRSFKDNLIYKAVLRHYIATLVKEKASFMWAIEGTRSRTGKLVWPKLGILKYIKEAEQEAQRDVKYVPVSVTYDLIPDVKEMTKQGRGKSKRPESFSWFLNYIRDMGDNFGRISLRIGDPVETAPRPSLALAIQDKISTQKIPRFALNIVHNINQITPVTTTSLICISLLSKYSMTKRAIENDVVDLMQLIESRKPDALVDRGRSIRERVQFALNLLTHANIILQHGDSLNSKYTMSTEHYLSATYYANMAVHHLYHRAFIEMALVKIKEAPRNGKSLAFWTEIMELRDLFKFEFFYSNKSTFTDEIESNLNFISPDWQNIIANPKTNPIEFLAEQTVLVSPAVLFTYIEAYRVIAHALMTWDPSRTFEEKDFIEACLALGEEMKWQGRIQRIESVSKPFLANGILLIKNRDLIPTKKNSKKKEIKKFLGQLDSVAERLNTLQGIALAKPTENISHVPVEREIVPGSKTATIAQDIFDGESGAHIGAFFDLDRTLIKGFSAKEFFQKRILSGKITSKEVAAQFAGVVVYAMGNGNFAGLAAIGAKGVKGLKEEVFIEAGEEVYFKHLAKTIYPEARALVAAHLMKGHTVAIISAATPYQVNPIARDLGIRHVMCTKMEVIDGTFTGDIVEPACWGDGKAYAAKQLTAEFDLDLSKSFFYTDSAEDMPLMEIVGNPRPMNPDTKLSAIAFENNWPIYRFSDEERPGISNLVRTGLAFGSLIPAAFTGLLNGSRNQSWRDGVNSMMATVGDLGTAMAGIKLAVKGKEHLWSHRPAIFIFNHQSNADLWIVAKLVRKDARGVAKKELQSVPILGQMMQAGGVIFLERGNREKAIQALKPAVDELKKGTSIIIAPEGTRSRDYRLGKFKKGAFHMAMKAGVPIVPIVIKNAHDVMPRGTALFRPAAVEVVILPPVSTEKWTAKNLNENIETIRNAYLIELGQLNV